MRSLNASVAALAAVALIVGVPASASPRMLVPPPQALNSVHGQVQTWLVTHHFSGFRVSEVMAFADNDYVAVSDTTGKPAFELLAWPTHGWVIQEFAGRMWNTRYGMMGGGFRSGSLGPMMMGGSMMGSSSWYATGSGKVSSVAQAATVANRWLVESRPGEKAETDGRAFPGYFTLDTTRNAKTTGMLSVSASTGAVWYHGWHGAFLAEKMFS
jgi:hypothetical protein